MQYDKFNSLFKGITVRRANLRFEMRSLLVKTLESFPDRTVSFGSSNAAYSYGEGADGWLEIRIHGIRLNAKGAVELATETDCDGMPKFDDRYSVADEHDKDIDVNWFSLLGAVEAALKAEGGKEKEKPSPSVSGKEPRAGCGAEFLEFGKGRPAAKCIGGMLFSTDSYDASIGGYVIGGKDPCPFCNTEAWLEGAVGDVFPTREAALAWLEDARRIYGIGEGAE